MIRKPGSTPGFFYEHFEELKPTVIAGTDQFLGVELHGYEVVAS